MNRITAVAIFSALIAWQGLVAYAQPALYPGARPDQIHRAGGPAISFTQRDAGSFTLQAYNVPQPEGAAHLGSVVTRLELECVLSGKCDAAERRRVNY